MAATADLTLRIRSLPRGEEMKAYRIERFGSVDGIVLRSSDDPTTRAARGPDAGARELAELSRPDGAEGRRPRSDQARRDPAFGRRRRSRCGWRRGDAGQSR